MKRRLIFLTILAAIVALIWWEERPRPQTLVLTGTVDGNEVVVGSKITGRIVNLAVDDGQRVKAGDLIAVLDQDELRADQGAADHAIAQARANTQQSAAQTELLQSTLPTKVQQASAQVGQAQAQLQQNQAQVAQAQAQLQQAQAQVAQTQAAVAKAQDNFNRIRPLVEKDINPPQDLVTARTDLQSAQANEQAARAAVEAAKKAVASAQAGAEATQRAVAASRAALADSENQERQISVQQRQTEAMHAAEQQAVANAAAAVARFDQTRIYAPASGIVTLRAARQGEVVNPGNPIVTLFDLSSTWVDADVEETYADLIKMGQTLTVRLPSGAEVTGPVIYKAVEADFATQRDVSRTKRDIKTVAIRVKVNNPDGELPLGMTAWVMLPVPALPPHPLANAAKRLTMEAQNQNEIAIDVSGISKRFNALLAVDNVSFTVYKGEIFGLLGPNGAGKSTLIRMLTTLVPPSSGTAIVAGHDIIRDPNAVRSSIGVIPQNMTSDPELTCAENIGIHARLFGITGVQRRRRTEELLEAVGLSDRANALAATLSGGMRRRLEIARGMVHNPQILFLDEPTTGLDPVSRISVWEMITKLRAQEGRTLFLTTHYMDEADRLCDRLAIVDKGKVVALDTPVSLKSQVPGASRIELQFEPDLPNGVADLEKLPAVKSVRSLGSATYRVSSDRGPASAQELIEVAQRYKLELKALSVQSTTLDDVFLHYTGHGLMEMPETAAPAGRGRGGH